MSAALFDPDAIVRAVRAAANLAPRCDICDFATNPADCRNVANVVTGDALANGGDCRNVAIVAAPIIPIDADHEAAIEERAGMASGSVPPGYIDAWARLNCQKPEGVSEAEWRLALDDGGRFLDEWGAETAALGWRPGELFDVTAGLVWRLAGQRVAYIGADRFHLRDGRVVLRMETKGWR